MTIKFDIIWIFIAITIWLIWQALYTMTHPSDKFDITGPIVGGFVFIAIFAFWSAWFLAKLIH